MTEAADVKCPDASPVGDVDMLDTSTVSYCGTKVAVAQPASSEPHAAGDTEVAGASSSEPHAADDTEVAVAQPASSAPNAADDTEVPVAQPASSEQHAADDSSDEDEGEPREFTAKTLFKGKVYTLQYTRQTQVKELKTMLQERSGSKVPIKVRYRVGNKFIYAGDALQLTEVMIHEVKVTENPYPPADHQAQLRVKRMMREATETALESNHKVAKTLRKAADTLEQNNGLLAEQNDSAGNVSEEHLKQLAEARSKFRRPHPLNVARILGQTQLTPNAHTNDVFKKVRANKTLEGARNLMAYCTIRLSNAEDPKDKELFPRLLDERVVFAAGEVRKAD